MDEDTRNEINIVRAELKKVTSRCESDDNRIEHLVREMNSLNMRLKEVEQATKELV